MNFLGFLEMQFFDIWFLFKEPDPMALHTRLLLTIYNPQLPKCGRGTTLHTQKKKKPVLCRYLENSNITLVICQISQTMIIQNDILTTESRRYEI
jgi:hypothetical protein